MVNHKRRAETKQPTPNKSQRRNEESSFGDEIAQGMRRIWLNKDNLGDSMRKLSINVNRNTEQQNAPCRQECGQVPPPRHSSHRRVHHPETAEKRAKRRSKWNSSANQPQGYITSELNNRYWDTTTLIIGHSFVTRLRKTLVQNNNNRIINWGNALNVEELGIRPFVYGIPGCRINDLHKFTGWIIDVQPDCLILDLGTNDIVGKRSARSLANELVAEMEALMDINSRLTSITWCHVIPRSEPSHGMTVKQFKKKADLFNRLVVAGIKRHAFIHHWKHRGLTQAKSSDLLTDGVHLNHRAMWKYQKSISRLVKWSRLNLG